MSAPRIAFLASPADHARVALETLVARHGNHAPEDADVLCALGGDGFMLQTLHHMLDIDHVVPAFGLNLGTVGFLMNAYREEGLEARLAVALRSTIHPLRMIASDKTGQDYEALAINEVALFRQTYQVAKLRILIDEHERMAELMADGILVATPAGSTAYNLSAHGPIIPLDAPSLALTPISAFRPRRWRGALLSHTARVRFDVLEPDKRPVSATADNFEVRRVSRVEVRERRDITLTMLFDSGRSYEERVMAEQFAA